jgi:hypothetical protein
MKHDTKHTDHRSKARIRTRRAGFAGVLIVIGLLAAGFGGGSRKDPAAGPSRAQAVEQAGTFSVCMRAHGLPNFPDPQISGSGGTLQAKITVTAHRGSAGVLNPSSPAFKTAVRTCANVQSNSLSINQSHG